MIILLITNIIIIIIIIIIVIIIIDPEMRVLSPALHSDYLSSESQWGPLV